MKNACKLALGQSRQSLRIVWIKIFISILDQTIMALECNIEARGKFVRLVFGAFAIIGSFPIIALTLYGLIDVHIGLLLTGVAWAGGALGIFEGWSGFCIARGLGFRTPI